MTSFLKLLVPEYVLRFFFFNLFFSNSILLDYIYVFLLLSFRNFVNLFLGVYLAVPFNL